MLGKGYILLINLICWSHSAARDPPIVTIPNQGQIMGKEITPIRTQRILAFLGIPYANPPMRFFPPDMDNLPTWDDVRNATDFEPACMQHKEGFSEEELPFIHLLDPDPMFNVSEDCLYLNVFVPYGQPPQKGFGVIVWIHPGNFKTGNPAMWNPYSIVFKQRVIVVTIAYRLNVFGFFSLTYNDASGNYGLLDQVAALKWVKTKIEAFGGNSDNICLMGYGAGAVSIGIHMVSPFSKGLFNKAISMSGNLLNPKTIKHPKYYTPFVAEVFKSFQCNQQPGEFIKCFRGAPLKPLAEFASHYDWAPIFDGEIVNQTEFFLPEHPRNYFERNDFSAVPFLTGFTDMEEVLSNMKILQPENDDAPEEYLTTVLTEYAANDLIQVNSTEACVHNYDLITDSLLFFYRPSPPAKTQDDVRKTLTNFISDRNYGSSTFQLAQYVSKNNVPTFVYRFDTKPTTEGAIAELPSWASVPHLFDLIYVWGMPFWTQLPNNQEWDNRDKKISDIIMNFWTNFAKTSNPTEGSLYPIKWDQFQVDNPGILIIDRSFNMSDSVQINYKAFDFWNNYLPKVIDIATQCCNATDNESHAINTQGSLFYFTTLLIFIFTFL